MPFTILYSRGGGVDRMRIMRHRESSSYLDGCDPIVTLKTFGPSAEEPSSGLPRDICPGGE